MARKYYYDTGEEKVGPVDGDELFQLRASGQLAPDTWVRGEDSATWRPLSSVDLREEEEEARNPSLWKILSRNLSLRSMVLGAAVLLVLLALLIFFISAAWPLLLMLMLAWLFMAALRR